MSSSKGSPTKHRRRELTSGLERGDRLVVSELSRLGRSLGQIVTIVDALAKAGVAFVALKENELLAHVSPLGWGNTSTWRGAPTPRAT